MSDEIKFRSDVTVELIDSMGNDQTIINAARVSTLTDDLQNTPQNQRGLARYLMKNRHGSPFEHVTFQWRIEAPIFVWREFMRHRMASYNEQSGRYTEMTPEFYIPPNSRKIVQVGKTGHYEFVDGDDEQWATVDIELEMQSRAAWRGYQTMLKKGVAKEVARMALPLNIYSRAYVTMNLRGLLNFLSLRTRSALSTYPSFPQEEIAWVADKMELSAYGVVPITMGLFNENGRVCP